MYRDRKKWKFRFKWFLISVLGAHELKKVQQLVALYVQTLQRWKESYSLDFFQIRYKHINYTSIDVR